MDKNTICLVKNRSAGSVCYRIPDENIRRFFQPGETKRITLGELEKLTFQSGGKELIANYLQLEKEEITEDLNIHTEPEYWMNEDQVKALLISGSLDELYDALDFAPEGVIDLIKDFAVSLPVNDVAKRQAIKEKTGFDVQAAVTHIQEENEKDDIAPVKQQQRRVQKTPERRTTPAYKVVKTN